MFLLALLAVAVTAIAPNVITNARREQEDERATQILGVEHSLRSGEAVVTGQELSRLAVQDASWTDAIDPNIAAFEVLRQIFRQVNNC